MTLTAEPPERAGTKPAPGGLPATGLRRLWSGWTTAENAAPYEALLTSSVIPGILDRGIAGLEGVEALRSRRRHGEFVEFLTVMSFADWPSVVEFAGGTGDGSVVPDTARRLLHHFDADSHHYDLLFHT
jgi:hypothetical protein